MTSHKCMFAVKRLQSAESSRREETETRKTIHMKTNTSEDVRDERN